MRGDVALFERTHRLFATLNYPNLWGRSAWLLQLSSVALMDRNGVKDQCYPAMSSQLHMANKSSCFAHDQIGRT